MIPDREPAPPPPLTLELVLLLAVSGPLLHLLWATLFHSLGILLPPSLEGMGALVTYVGFVWLCALRLRAPARFMGFVPAPPSAWLAVLFLAPVIVLSSELDNILRLMFPVPDDPSAAAAVTLDPRLYLASLFVLHVGVMPLCFDLFYRGIVLPASLQRLGVIPGLVIGTVLSVLGSSFVYALDGAHAWLMLPEVPLALALCLLRTSSRSLLPVLALDVLWGAARVAGSLKLFGLEGFDAGGSRTPGDWLLGAAIATAIGLVLCAVAARAGASSTPPAQPTP
jgi:hypothetical protein